jgi:predicted Rossmann fold flavoprotein
MKEAVDVVVIGGGAAGCFAAIQAGTHFPDARIVILERGIKPLAKVKISGGGRCNVTNTVSDPVELSANYPRGERFLRKAFYAFSSSHMIQWLGDRGIELREYPDGCLFPVTNDSQTIIDCFLSELKKLRIPLRLESRVDAIQQTDNGWEVTTPSGSITCKSVVLTVGGQPKISGFQLLKSVDLKIIPPIPSLFTFNMPNEPIRELMGVVTENASVRIIGEKWSTSGPLLITHWGMSGPAVLKCSAFGARILEEKGYKSGISVNWTGFLKQDEVRVALVEWKSSNKKLLNTPLFQIKSRLWTYLLGKCELHEDLRWSELGSRQENKLIEVLINDVYQMEGKTTFKEEFVTAGGIDLAEIDVKTMQSKRYRGLFFAGEVMDIDGVTGGFNFQAAWTTATIAGKSVLLNQTEVK